MKNNYTKLVGLLMVMFLMSSPLFAQEKKLQIKNTGQPEPAKAAAAAIATKAIKKDVVNPNKPAHTQAKKELRKPAGMANPGGGISQNGSSASVTEHIPPGSTLSTQKKEPRVKQEKPTPEQRRAAKKQYYTNQTSLASPADTIKKNQKGSGKKIQNPKKRKLMPGDRIVGGENYTIEQIPWQVWLGGCGGSILGEEWVITAAHCGPSVGDPIYAGQTTRSGGASQMRTAAEVYIYEGFTSTVSGKDIALIRVNQPFNFNDPKVQPIPYATPADVANGLTDPCVMALTSGWGALSPGGSSPDHLQGVLVPIVSNALTDIAYIGWNGLTAGWLTADQIGAGDYAPQGCGGAGDGGEDACQGDSGGPLVVPNASGTGWILAGIVSWGESCADPDYPGMYARVSEFAAWIEQITGIVNNQYPDLIISEVVHGTEAGGNPKYVEIHNAGTGAYNLDNVAIRVFTNGATTPSATIDLPNVTLNGGETFVVASEAFQASWGGAFATATADLINAGITGDGNDAYQLYDTENDGIIDVFGQIGTNGSYWGYAESIVTRNPWVVSANSGGFNESIFNDDWSVEAYTAANATPGTHTAAIPAFDASLVSVTGIREGQTFVGCDGTANVHPGVSVFNSGTGAISSLDVTVTFNGVETTHTVTFTPALEPGTTRTASLPELTISTEGNYTYSVSVSDANDGNPTNDESEEKTFSILIFTDATTLNVVTRVDEYSPQENRWVIKDLAGNVIIESAPMAGSGEDIQFACVEDGSYTFTLIDTFGDGIFDGGITVTLEDGTPIIIIDGEDPIFDNQCFFIFCPEPSERSITIPFTIPYVPTPDLAVELTSPASNPFAFTSCEPLFTPAITVTNTGNIPVTEFAISYGVGAELETIEFDELLIQPGASRSFNLNAITLAEGANTLEVNLIDFNGTGADSNPANDSDEAVINFTLDEDLTTIIIALQTDSYSEETSWEIRDASGTVVATGSDYPASQLTEIPVCLPDGDYTFVLKDAYGDGIFVTNAVVIKTESGTIITIISGDFESETTAEFSLPFTGAVDVSVAVVTPATASSQENCTPLVDVVIKITNEGNSPVTAITVTYGIGENEETVELTGLLNAGEFAEVALGKIAVVPGSNTLNVSIDDVNGGGPDSNPENDQATSTFTFTEDTEFTGLTVSVDLDDYPSETSWEITDQAGNVVAESSSYTGLANTTQIDIACLPSGCYTFTLYDSWGDGGPIVTLLVNGAELATVGGGSWAEVSTTVCVGDVTYPVSNLTAQAASATSIELNWTYGFEADNFAIFRSSTGSVGSYVPLATVPATTLTYTSTGLQPETMYYYSVIAIHDGENSIPVYASASTTANLGETVLMEGFEGTTFPPPGWIMLDEDGDNNNWFHYTNQAVGAVVAYEGVKSAASASWTSAQGPLTPDNWLVTPAVNIEEGYKLYFRIAGQDPDYSDETYAIMISTTDTDPSNFTEVLKETLPANDGTWLAREVDLNEYAGETIYIAFRHYDASDVFYIKLDEVIVGIEGDPVDPPAVPEPADFTATATSAYNVNLNWSYEENANAFTLYVSTTGAIGSFELWEVLSGDITTYSASGLTPSTTYYFQLTATIGDETSLAASAVATTPSASSGQTAFAEGFEGTTFPPPGWIMVDEDGDNNRWFHYTNEGVGEAVAYEGVKCAASASWTSAQGPLTPDNWLVTPPIEIAADYKLFFHIAGQDPDYSSETYAIMISTTDTDPASFTQVLKETLPADNGNWLEREVDLSAYEGQTIYIAFRHFDISDFFYIKLDNVIVGIPGTPPPAPVTDLEAVALSESSVTLTWDDASDNEDGFNVQVSYTESGPWTDYTPDVSANTETVTISSPSLIVYGDNFFRVRSFNENGASAWSAVASATTHINQPTGFTAQALSEAEVKLTWNDESAIEDGYRIEMATASDGPWTLVTQTAANVETHTVNGLQTLTQYFFRVRSFNQNGTSEWLQTSVTTLITGIETANLADAVSVYPNPGNGTFRVHIGDAANVTDYTVAVLDSKGLLVESFTAKNQHEAGTIFKLKNPVKGLYILRIGMGKNSVTKKLIVE